MSYKEFSQQANYAKYHTYPDDYPTHKPYTEEEKRDFNKIFESPVFGAKLTHEKAPSVKGGDIHKNTAI